MGIKLEAIIDKYSLLIHNTGVSTYRSGSVSTSPDVTVSVGLTQYGNIFGKPLMMISDLLMMQYYLMLNKRLKT